MSTRERAVNDLQVERSVEFMHTAAAIRAVLSDSITSSSGRRRQQPGEAQEAPFSDLPIHRGSRAGVDGRVGALPELSGGQSRRPVAGCG